MGKTFVAIFCTVLIARAAAQTTTVFVKDSLTRAPVPFATLRLRYSDSTEKETISDDKGKFTFRKVPKGDMTLTVTSVGYNTKTIVLPEEGKPDTLFLGPRTEMLKEVIVDSKKYLIEERIDRTIYNVDRDKTLSGGDAVDAMRRVPLLSVDIDGNVTLRGSPNFKVLINNKPSTITADNLADALKQISADQIKSIEVITSPSAKYDAEGSAGIINIVLKKNELRGVLLNSDMALGTRASFLGLDGSYNNRKMGFSVGGFGRATYHVTGEYQNVQGAGPSTTYQTAATRKDDLAGNYNLGWEYEPDKRNFLTASLRYNLLDGHNFQDNLLTDSTLLDQVQTTARSGTADLSVDYTHAFARPQQEFSFLTLYSRTDRTNGFTDVQQDTIPVRFQNNNVSSNQEFTLQADYQTPLDSNQLLDFGAKYILRDAISNYNYQRDFILETNPDLTNQFNYQQHVAAGYAEYTLTTKSPYSFRVGARYEFTSISARLQDSSLAPPSYGVLAPTFNIARRLKNGKLLKLAYTRRIQRPSIQFLNPNLVASNPLSVTIGNPALGPEYTSNIELDYTTAIRQTTLGFDAFYRHTAQAIESLSLPKGDTIERTYANIGIESTYGLNVFVNLELGQKLSLSGGADLYYTQLGQDGWTVNARLSGGYTFKKGWSIYLFSRFQGKQILPQGTQSGFPYYSLTLKREIWRKKGTIGLGAENFFSPSITVRNEVQSADFYQYTANLTHTLSFRVYFNYRIGKLTVERPERKKKSVSNDDLK